MSEFRKEMNFRELGGYPTRDGRQVKHGVLYRSAAPALFNEEEMEIVKGLGLRTMIDFRNSVKARILPDPTVEGCNNIFAPAAFEHIHDDVNSYWDFLKLFLRIDKKGSKIMAFAASYMAELIYTNDAYQRMFDELLSGNTPLLFHCSQGKDRTGIGAVLILLALNVDHETIQEDYVKSNLYRRSIIEARMKGHPLLTHMSKNIRHMFQVIEGVMTESVNELFLEMERRYGHREQFLLAEYGMDDGKLNNNREMITK